jgi:hypothetical protein
MTTIAKTSAAAVSRKLNALGFDKYNNNFQMGVQVFSSMDGITVVNHTNSDYEGTAAQELESAGYVIVNRAVRDWSQFLSRKVEVFNVIGRVEA